LRGGTLADDFDPEEDLAALEGEPLTGDASIQIAAGGGIRRCGRGRDSVSPESSVYAAPTTAQVRWSA